MYTSQQHKTPQNMVLLCTDHQIEHLVLTFLPVIIFLNSSIDKTLREALLTQNNWSSQQVKRPKTHGLNPDVKSSTQNSKLMPSAQHELNLAYV